jgi:hypothetical protein
MGGSTRQRGDRDMYSVERGRMIWVYILHQSFARLLDFVRLKTFNTHNRFDVTRDRGHVITKSRDS